MKKVVLAFLLLSILLVTCSCGGNTTKKQSDLSDLKSIQSAANSSLSSSSEISSSTVSSQSAVSSKQQSSSENAAADANATVNNVKSENKNIKYINGILIVNKTYGLPKDYNPGVDPTALSAAKKMFADAAKEGLDLYISSSFRSYSRQNTLYNNYAAQDGKAAADRYSARPGYSEHQTGLAFDLNSVDSSFENTKECAWVAKNCYKYGFIIRYPKGKESITGYMYEPWHIRYLGVDNAKMIYNSGKTIEEYFNITSGYAN